MKPRLSVVTPTYRPFDYWRRQFDWLDAQKLDHALFEWVIVDDHWWEHQTRVAKLPPHDFGIVHRPPGRLRENVSVCSAFNDGIANAQGELVYLMADYMQPLPDTFARHLELLDLFGEKCFFSGPVLPHQRGRDDQRTQIDRWEAEVFDRIAARGIFWGGRNDSVPRSALMAVNGFDERLDGYRGAMDADLAHRLMNSGCRYIIDLKLDAGAGMHAHEHSKGCLGDQELNPRWTGIAAGVVAGEHEAGEGLVK